MSNNKKRMLELCSVFKHDFNNAYVSLLLNTELIRKLINNEEIDSLPSESEKDAFLSFAAHM